MTNLKQAMAMAKKTKKPQKVTEPTEVKAVKVSTSIRLDLDTLNYFKEQANKTGVGYQTLINSVLVQHAKNSKTLEQRIEIIEKQLKIE